MPAGNGKNTKEESKIARARYEATKLDAAQRNIHVFSGIASVSNFLFLLCDLFFIQDRAERLIAGILRYCFSILLILLIRKLQRIKTFAAFSIVVSLQEVLAVLMFLSVLQFYENPEFMVQSMGMLLTILVIFLVPNRWENMLVLAIAASGAFFLLAYFRFPNILLREFTAAVFYAAMTILLCAVKTIGTDRAAQREFAAKTRLEQTSSRDFLTSAATRERLEEEAKRWMNFCRRQGLPLCLVFADVDDLKQINDRFGHTMGDAALREVAAVMRNQLRNSDTIARWGGDEFVLLLPNVTLQNAVLLLDRVRLAVSQIRLSDGITVSCSFGVVQMDPDSDYAQMLSAADKMMYHAKKDGKGRVSATECYESNTPAANKETVVSSE